MLRYLLVLLSLFFLSSCYCACKYPSDYLVPEYDASRYFYSKEGYRKHQRNNSVPLYDYDLDYIPPVTPQRNYDYYPLTPGIPRDRINDYPTGR